MKQKYIKCPRCERDGIYVTEGNPIVRMMECKFCGHVDMSVKARGVNKWIYPAYESWERANGKFENWRKENARAIRVDTINLRLRFRVFKRDDYRCRICGRNADDGVKLELGHRVARARGGRMTEDNLLTLCFDCNRGMYTDEL